MQLNIIKQFDVDIELIDMLPLGIQLQFNRVIPQTIELDLMGIQQALMLFKYSSMEFSTCNYIIV